MEDPIKLHRETIEISGDREMYIYTFDLEGEPMPEMNATEVEGPKEEAHG